MAKIAFYKAWQDQATILDKLIAIATISDHSHVELIFSDNIAYSISAREKTSRLKKIDFDSGHWDIIHVDIPEHEEDQLRFIAMNRIGLEYDYLGAFFSFYKSWKITKNLFSRCLHKKKTVFCSEEIVNLLRDYTEMFSYLEEGCKYAPGRFYEEVRFTALNN